MKALIRHFVQFKIVRYLISGGTAAAINLSLLFLLTEFVGMWYLASSVLSFIAGFTASFLFQKFWTFRDTRREVIPRQLVLHLGAALGTLFVNTALLYVAVDVFDMWYMLAQFIVSGMLAVGSFFIYNLYIFRNPVEHSALQTIDRAPEISFPLAPIPGVASQYIRVYIGTPLTRMRPLLILKQQLNLPDYKGEKPFRAVYGAMDFSFLTLSEKPEDADFFLLPHSYFSACAVGGRYVPDFVRLAARMKKRIVLFSEGDADTAIHIPHAIVFRTSQYAHQKKQNEIIMPPQVYADDVLKDSIFSLRAKREKPVVSFCGWSEFGTLRGKAKFLARNIYADFRTHILRDSYAEPGKQGIYFRKKAIAVLSRSPLVETSFITRDFFSVNKHTIKLPREILRAQYLENMVNSDFVLAPKGDGNFSIRFYEALALGRIPVLIDTGSILPLEDEISYSKYIVRVPYQNIEKIGEYVSRFYHRLTPEAYEEAQRGARALFMRTLRLDVFLKNTLSRLFLA
ncbi:MAG: hypothetical protein A3D67_02020 [Candidatus Lloydbacteria bacterium RIFCSPHIGHO2_02_FULL_51_22]|uniref:GtrA-like protein domain-containing protein n=3 Tax=Candidatus Lloydiibacteriota TaxID=1817910 RepID=A0A1G2DAA4_9BACT|nr:MAG: hypothetical protein A3D67_02020 [Candidatus Lloydbacteria bacterium RIFCSPHIGHO2_02_FULL_51_22]OGZ15188.1 MAG: hypothetical protein A3J08_02950 [Candidatus Lloydbacteria bacterium RIFCSPLOWO2_02_FULL_51_11]OGZ16272.1 MAG: hypothetical protein A3G11_01070 [Candidatus Lloydbacteria bacterium RIFCSPLOWO2_12_FULL_51_9]